MGWSLPGSHRLQLSPLPNHYGLKSSWFQRDDFHIDVIVLRYLAGLCSLAEGNQGLRTFKNNSSLFVQTVDNQLLKIGQPGLAHCKANYQVNKMSAGQESEMSVLKEGLEIINLKQLGLSGQFHSRGPPSPIFKPQKQSEKRTKRIF